MNGMASRRTRPYRGRKDDADNEDAENYDPEVGEPTPALCRSQPASTCDQLPNSYSDKNTCKEPQADNRFVAHDPAHLQRPFLDEA